MFFCCRFSLQVCVSLYSETEVCKRNGMIECTDGVKYCKQCSNCISKDTIALLLIFCNQNASAGQYRLDWDCMVLEIPRLMENAIYVVSNG